MALAEACLATDVGFEAEALALEGRLDAALFGETASRAVVSVRVDDGPAVEALLAEIGLPFGRIGRVGGDRLRLAPFIDAALADLREAYEGGLEEALAGS